MRKTSATRPLQQVIAYLSDIDVKKLDLLLNEDGLGTSRSDILRRAFQDYFEAKRPRYVFEKSGKDLERRAAIKEKENWENMSDLDYAKSLNGIIMPSRDGKLFVVMLAIGNSQRVTPVEGLKRWKGQDIWDSSVEDHKQQLDEGASLLQRIDDNFTIQQFDREYNIDLEAFLRPKRNDTDKSNDNSNTGLPSEQENTGLEA